MTPDPFDSTTEVLEGNIHQISLRGELDLQTAPQLERDLRIARKTEGISVLINLSDCEFIDSSGLALIVQTWREFERKRGDEGLVLCCAKDQVERLLKITGIDESISVYDDIDEALAELQGDNEAAQPA